MILSDLTPEAFFGRLNEHLELVCQGLKIAHTDTGFVFSMPE